MRHRTPGSVGKIIFDWWTVVDEHNAVYALYMQLYMQVLQRTYNIHFSTNLYISTQRFSEYQKCHYNYSLCEIPSKI